MAAQRSELEVSIGWNQFWLEPDQPSDVEYWLDNRECDQGFSSYPGQAAIGTPSESYLCRVHVDVRVEAPELQNCVQAVCFPITVGEEGSLFLRSLFGDDDDENRIDISPGKYDVVVRYFPLEAEQAMAEVELRAWRVELSFLPGGAMKPGTFRLEYGAIPSEAFVHS